MFKKLVSNLPFSPSLISQLGFYSQRLKKERATRRIGLIFTILALIMQSVTFLAPAQATLAASANDIIYNGGGKTKAGVLNAYNSNRDELGRRDIQKIFNHYGINGTNLKASKVVTIKSTAANNYWSTGRAPRGHGGEVAVQIPNGPRIYSRTLHGWAANRNWAALEIDTAAGKRWILLECGNVVTQTIQKPKRPNMKVTKSANKSSVKPGEKITFTLTAENAGDATAKNVLIYDDAPAGLELLSDNLGNNPLKSSTRWETHQKVDYAPGQKRTYRINARATNWGPVTLTNRACVDFFDYNIWDNCGTATVTVPPACPVPGKDKISKDDPSCKTSPGLKIEKTTNTKDHMVGDTFDYTLTVSNTGDANFPSIAVKDIAPTELEFTHVREFDSGKFTPLQNSREYTSPVFPLGYKETAVITLRAKVIKHSPTAINNTACVSSQVNTQYTDCDDEPITVKEVCPTNPEVATGSPECYPPCPVPGKDHLPQNSPECQPCDESQHDENDQDISCLELRKHARNLTQEIDNANGTQASPGDQIEYTLSVTNRSKQVREDFVIEENIEDVLEYADIMDASGATFTENPVRMLLWSPVDIQPNETINRTVLIKVKTPLPTTPASTSDPYSYDLKMTNIYGNTIQIDLPDHPVKSIERTITRLPETGIGTNTLISTLLLGTVTYFYYRSRLLLKEVGLVKQQFNHGAGV